MKWTDKEEGPACFCGMPTIVTVAENGDASLVCLYHEADRGALFPLPRDKRPDNWPKLTEDEIDKVMFEGQDEADAKLAQEAKGDEQNKFGLS